MSIQLSIHCQLTTVNTQTVQLIKYITPKFNVLFEFLNQNYSGSNPRSLFLGGGGYLYMEEVYRFKNWFLNAPGLIHGRALLSGFYGVLVIH